MKYEDLIRRGLARNYRGRLIPVLRGGDPAEQPFPAIPEDLGSLSSEDLESFIDDSKRSVKEVAGDPVAYVTDERDAAALLDLAKAQVEAIGAAETELAARVETPAVDDETAQAFADLAASTDDDPAEIEVEVEEVEETEPIVASADPDVLPALPVRPLPRPARSRDAAPVQQREETHFSLTASIGGYGFEPGQELNDEMDVAKMMIRRRSQFGSIPAGTSGEKIPIARVDYSDGYGDRTLDGDEIGNETILASVLDPKVIRANMDARKKLGDSPEALLASGGLCAPVTPYYQLMMISTADRPVRASLPGFNADRGGIRFAAPATLASITTGTGTITAANDLAGGTFATKSCQIVSCPSFSEVDVATIFHCLQFGNLGARTFPERVAQWNQLVLAAQARLAESALLTGIDTASTAVTAGSLGLGATGDILGEVLVASAGMRSRHRMAPDAVLRAVFPAWVLSLFVSDVYRSQFQRWDMTPERFVALLRAANVEPTFHLDGASGQAQVFGTQTAAALLPFPANVVWYLFPEGSFLFIDGGTLELGLVRDSVLNKTNDFQLFGETFENIAFVGVESLKITSSVCDSGITAGTHNTICPLSYSYAS